MIKKRSSGILLHLTSLPGKHGIGDLGPESHRFIDFLEASGQCSWQYLPTGPTSTVFDNSPYMCRSVFAGNPLLINLNSLKNDGLLSTEDLADPPDFSEYLVDFPGVASYKNGLLHKAFIKFLHSDRPAQFRTFCRNNTNWLDDYALFMALRKEFNLAPWYEWPDYAARRKTSELKKYASDNHDSLLYHKFVQYVFFSQWQELYEYAHNKNIKLIGDIPIYVALDSADVWANQALFKIDTKTLKPAKVSGVPPDYFSETGQRWGNPVYRWKTADRKINRQLYDWWLARFRQMLTMMDMVKIDHFRGFEAFWEIPAHEETAVNGKWVKGPGKPFFSFLEKELGSLPIIAEDLGVITPAVEKMRDQLGLPGMKVLQFGFESDARNPYLPHNFDRANSVVYTGTHDNNTSLGWFLGDITEETRQRIREYISIHDDSLIAERFVRLAMASTADLAILPMQDILGFGADCRMNIPGTRSGNWRWRCAPRFINETLAENLHDMTIFYNRLG